jgi:predicted nucleic acid-binding protein
MATTNVEPIFIDTNALIRANVVTAPLHKEALAAVQSFESVGTPLWVSRQVLREYLATLSKPQTSLSIRFKLRYSLLKYALLRADLT